jgi:hypothetical protein
MPADRSVESCALTIRASTTPQQPVPPQPPVPTQAFDTASSAVATSIVPAATPATS